MTQLSFERIVGAPQGRRDAVVEAYEGMSEEDKEAFRKIIQDPDYTNGQIAAGMTAIGHDVDRSQIQHYRRKLREGKVSL